MNSKKCIVTIVNIEYLEIFNKFLYFYNKNSQFDLIVYTINFDYSHKSTNSIKYISYFDSNILDYESKIENKYIKNFSDKYKYIVALKPKIINQSLLLDYDCFLYLDADCIITPYFDDFYKNFNDLNHQYPLCPNYREDFMMYKNKGLPFKNDGSFDLSMTLEAELFNFFNIKQNRSAYRHTYAYIYNKRCKNFFLEASDILFNFNLFNEYDKYFPLLDESVFNFIFWKNDYKKSLGVLNFIDLGLNFRNDISKFENFSKKQKIACIHAKFYKKKFDSTVLENFKEVDDEKYNYLEKIYKNVKKEDLFYNISFENSFICFNFLFLSDKKLNYIILDNNSNILYRKYDVFFEKMTSYYVTVYCLKNSNIELIFFDENDSIVYSINETFSN